MKNSFIFISIFLITTSCLSINQNNQYSKIVINGGFGEDSYLIKVPVKIDDTVSDILIFHIDLLYYLLNDSIETKYSKRQKLIKNAIKNQEPIIVDKNIEKYMKAYVLYSPVIDSLKTYYEIDGLARLFINKKNMTIPKDVLNKFSQKQINYLLALFIDNKYYIKYKNYGVLQISKTPFD